MPRSSTAGGVLAALQLVENVAADGAADFLGPGPCDVDPRFLHPPRSAPTHSFALAPRAPYFSLPISPAPPHCRYGANEIKIAEEPWYIALAKCFVEPMSIMLEVTHRLRAFARALPHTVIPSSTSSRSRLTATLPSPSFRVDGRSRWSSPALRRSGPISRSLP